MRTIFNHTPKDWQELEEMVAQVFSEMGFDAQRSKTIETVRNNVVVDVVANDLAATPAVKIFVECKQWKKKIPQDVVHAFRTVIQDAGANLGIIVAAKGFQVGAIDAAQSSNLLLLNWLEFQEYFYERWLQKMIIHVGEYADDVIEFYDYFGKITRGLGEGTNGRSLLENQRIAESIQEKYIYFLPISKYTNMLPNHQIKFPLHLKSPHGSDGDFYFATPREYFDMVIANRDIALAEFNAFIRGEE